MSSMYSRQNLQERQQRKTTTHGAGIRTVLIPFLVLLVGGAAPFALPLLFIGLI